MPAELAIWPDLHLADGRRAREHWDMLAPRFHALPIVSVLALAGCSSSTDGQAPTPPAAPPAEAWTVLAQGDWTLEPGTEEVDHCIKVTIQEDIYVSRIRPIAPEGTHHTFVALSD